MKRSQTESELIKEIKRLSKNIKRRINRVIKRYGQTPGIERAMKGGKLDSKVAKLNEKQLREKLRELKYIDSLKTTTVKGTKSYKENFKGIEQFLKDNPDYKDKFWELYDKLINERRILEHYKYDVMDILSESMSYGVEDYEQVKNMIDNALGEQLENTNEDSEDEDDEGEDDIW